MAALPEPPGWPGDVPTQGVHITRRAPFWSFTERSKARAPTQLVPLTALYSSQPTVGRELVHRLLREAWNSPPLIMPWEGRWAVQDGHHRITAAALRGADYVLCRIVQPSDRA